MLLHNLHLPFVIDYRQTKPYGLRPIVFLLDGYTTATPQNKEANCFCIEKPQGCLHVYLLLFFWRRHLCWEISDILYLPLNIRNYTYKGTPMGEDSAEILRNWSSVDFQLYQMANRSLWWQVSEYGQDFWNEFDFFRNQKKRIFKFCKPVLHLAKIDSSKLKLLLEQEISLTVPDSSWGRSYNIDPVWCLMSQIDQSVFRNILRVKGHPELCGLIQNSNSVGLREFDIAIDSSRVWLNPDYCSQNTTSDNSSFQIPMSVLLNSSVYCSADRPAADTVACWQVNRSKSMNW